MKTRVKVSALILMALVLSTKAQINNNNPKPVNYVSHGGSNSNSPPQNQNQQYNSSNWQNNNNEGSFTVNFSNYPPNGFGYVGPTYNYYSNPYYGCNSNKMARSLLFASKSMINQAIDIHNWNDNYSPMLAKAIRHHNYAKQMYWWGNYDAAINHAERAKYLAWCSLKYFQNPNYNNGYGGGYYQDPYGDPNDPYYRKGNVSGNAPNNKDANGNKNQVSPEANEIDKKLPEAGGNDKELIDTFDRSKDE